LWSYKIAVIPGAAILKSIETTLVDKSLCTRDVGTSTAGTAIANALASLHALA
jgi:hypothetical protein